MSKTLVGHMPSLNVHDASDGKQYNLGVKMLSNEHVNWLYSQNIFCC